MSFNENSTLVQFNIKRIREEIMEKEDVPNLFNLRDVVYSIIDN